MIVRRGVSIDTAGGRSGGAGRFREQLQTYLEIGRRPDVSSIGEESSLNPKWLALREVHAFRSTKVIAANNVGFLAAGRIRWVLLRNANHFLTDSEWSRERQFHHPSFGRQIAYARNAARRADTIVVPSSSMRDRVVKALPSAASRVVVRFHPLEPAAPQPLTSTSRDMLLVPIVPSAFKRLDEHLRLLRAAISDRDDITVVCTMTPDMAPPELVQDRRFRFVGLMSRDELTRMYPQTQAFYYPTAIESFGYPLAEARANGIPIIALDNPHNAEIAGPALMPFQRSDIDSLRDALDLASKGALDPDPLPFDPHRYFDWLFS